MIDRAIGIIIAIVGLASLAVVLSKKSATSSVLDSGLGGISGLIRTAVSPITGN